LGQKNWETILSAANSTFDAAFSFFKGELLRTVLHWEGVGHGYRNVDHIIKIACAVRGDSPESCDMVTLMARFDSQMKLFTPTTAT